MQKGANNENRNAEGYKDETPYKAFNSIAAEKKAYHLFETIINVARLAGFEVKGTVKFIGRDSKEYDGLKIKEAWKRKRV